MSPGTPGPRVVGQGPAGFEDYQHADTVSSKRDDQQGNLEVLRREARNPEGLDPVIQPVFVVGKSWHETSAWSAVRSSRMDGESVKGLRCSSWRCDAGGCGPALDLSFLRN